MNRHNQLLAITAIIIFSSPTLRADHTVLVAGGGTGGDGSQAVSAKLTQPFAIDFASDGSLLFVEMVGGERLRRIAPDGTISTLAGTGEQGIPGKDGPGDQATFNGMHDLKVLRDGQVLLADTFNHRVRIFDPGKKLVRGFAGTGEQGFGGDGGPAASAKFHQTISIATSRDGSTLYVTDIGNRRIRAIELATGVVTTVAGNGQKGEPTDGTKAIDQPLVDPRAVAIDEAGKLYIVERGGHRLRVVDSEGKIKTVAGTGKAGQGGDGGPALKAPLNGPKYLSCSKDGSVLIVDTENHQIRRYVPGRETVELVAGTGKAGDGGMGGAPELTELARPHGAVEHPVTGEIYIADSDNNRIIKIAHGR